MLLWRAAPRSQAPAPADASALREVSESQRAGTVTEEAYLAQARFSRTRPPGPLIRANPRTGADIRGVEEAGRCQPTARRLEKDEVWLLR